LGVLGPLKEVLFAHLRSYGAAVSHKNTSFEHSFAFFAVEGEASRDGERYLSFNVAKLSMKTVFGAQLISIAISKNLSPGLKIKYS